MTTRYYINSGPSIVGGTLAVGGAIALLTRDAFQTGMTLEHALMPVLVGLTVLFGHEAWRALKEFKVISFVAFVMLAVFGSGIIVTETMGRRAETRDAKVAQATKTVDQYATIAADYERTKKLVEQAEKWVAGACASGPGPNCRGQTFTLNQRKASANELKGQLEQAAAPAPVDSKADRVGAVASVFGLQAKDAVKAFQTFDPFTLALFFELGAIFGFGFGVKCRKVRDPVEAKAIPAEVPKALSFERPLSPAEIEDIKETQDLDREVKQVIDTLSKMAGRRICITDLAKLIGTGKSEAVKRADKTEDAGLIYSERVGKYRYLHLVHDADKKAA